MKHPTSHLNFTNYKNPEKLFKGVLFILCLLLVSSVQTVQSQYLTRDLNVDLLINQAGYRPEAAKTCVTMGESDLTFQIVNLENRNIVFEGKLQPQKGDFGSYLNADFSELEQPGRYYIKTEKLRSYPFTISPNVYEESISLIVNYFSKQRCGFSTTGYLTPCHADDGIRMDNGKRQDVSGGWHDASDLRKWVGATIYGMIGLSKAYQLTDSDELKSLIVNELKWGNQYFLKMQEPEGYIMSYVGGDVQKHSDSNRWTDNEAGEEGGELHFVEPSAGESTADMLIFGTNDDRVIRTDPLDIMGQYNFIASEAIMAKITARDDSEYSNRCLEAAIKGFNWCDNQDFKLNPGSLGAGIHASIELYNVTENPKYKEKAVEMASSLKKLQEDNNEPVKGFYYISEEGNEPYKNISRGCLELIAICDMIRLFPDHQDVDSWKYMVKNYAENYLLKMLKKNNFGIIPFGLYTEDPGGDRKLGEFWYRYFMQPELDWWVGINANIASAGVGLLKAAEILENPDLSAAAQHQLDWILGKNPFNSSTLIGVGYNHPEHFPGSTFIPRTPVIQGAVMNGLGGDRNDQPTIGTGNWQISEYWTPMVAYTLWLLSEMSAM